MKKYLIAMMLGMWLAHPGLLQGLIGDDQRRTFEHFNN